MGIISVDAPMHEQVYADTDWRVLAWRVDEINERWQMLVEEIHEPDPCQPHWLSSRKLPIQH